MRIVFISNFLNHHQTPFCEAMKARVEEFHFIATVATPEKFLAFGYEEANEKYDYVVRSYESQQAWEKAKRLCLECDVLIAGTAPEEFLIPRLKAGKATFRYSERLYKKKPSLWDLPHDMISAWLHMGRYQKYPFYMLSASAYTALDTARFGNFRNRCYKWGYFPPVRQHNINALMEQKRHEIPRLLWAGRFVDWKHPDDVIELARRLKKDGYKFRLDLIGAGPMEQQLEEMIRQWELSDCVYLPGSMKQEEVRSHMEAANLYFFTSDRNEGWGAVLNESMNSGCAVIASHMIGSVPFLVKNGENGMIYRSGDVDMLYEKAKYLLDHPQQQERLGKNACRTMVELWNAETAAERLVQLIENILAGKVTPFAEGPCSTASILREDWFEA